MALFIGAIDPGKSGGWAVYRAGKLYKAGPLLFDDPEDLFNNLDQCGEILIERAQSAPGQANGFEYGRSFGRAESVAMLTGAVIYYCAPAWWKGKLGVPADKELARQYALKTIPRLEQYVTLKKHDGIAEAALIGQVLLDAELFNQLVKNNAERAKSKRKRTSFRL